jgi:hypothetical protein
MSGRPVPPHGSGIVILPPQPPALKLRSGDPDDTLGRALYRQLAESQVRTDTAIQRAVRLEQTCQHCGTLAGQRHGDECPASPLELRAGGYGEAVNTKASDQ